MKKKIEEQLPNHKLQTFSAPNFYIADYKDMRRTFDRSDVALTDTKPEGVNFRIRGTNKAEIKSEKRIKI